MGQIDFDGSNSTVKADVIRGQTGTTVKLGGLLDTDGNYIQTEKGGDLTSASPLVIDTDGDYFDVTGTVSFAAMTVAADRQFTLQFDGALTMTHHATNLDLPGEANITTAAGDVATFQSTGSNTVQCIAYTKADGTPVVSAGGGKVLQVVVGNSTTQTFSTSTSYATANLSASITPSAESSLIFIQAHCPGQSRVNAAAATNQVGYYALFRGDVAGTMLKECRIGSQTDPMPANNEQHDHSVSLTDLDSPSTASAQTYTVGFKSISANCTIAAQSDSDEGTIILMEIDGT